MGLLLNADALEEYWSYDGSFSTVWHSRYIIYSAMGHIKTTGF